MTSKPETKSWTLEAILERNTRNGQFRRSELLSALVHSVVVLALISLPYINGGADMKPKPQTAEITSWGELGPDVPSYRPARRAGRDGGGGGGGERNPLAASRGRLPRQSLLTQLTPPAAVPRNLNPRLPAEPTIVVAPEIALPRVDMTAYGDPRSNAMVPSGGPGSRGGIGSGNRGSVGPDDGLGYGPGKDQGCCGGVYSVGGGISAPACIYCPQPEYSEEARKSRYQGKVMLWAVVDEQGRVREVRLVKAVGMGLDEEAIATVQGWRFRPAERGSRAVPVFLNIEVDFHLH